MTVQSTSIYSYSTGEVDNEHRNDRIMDDMRFFHGGIDMMNSERSFIGRSQILCTMVGYFTVFSFIISIVGNEKCD